MIDLKKMIDAGVHFGHKTSRWSPKMRPFIWGAKNKVHLIDVSKTAILLERAGNFLKETTSNGGKVLLVGTKKPAQSIIHRVATSTKMPFVIHRWVGGTLSNYEQVKKAVTRLLHMRDILQKSTTHYKKKEISMIQKELARLEKNVGGIIDFEYPPTAIVVIDVKKEHSAIKEASRLGIPVIALVDTNCDPEGVTFIIPANDDSPKAISFVLSYLEERLLEGLKENESAKAKARAEKAEQEAHKKAAAKIIAHTHTQPATPSHARPEHAPHAAADKKPFTPKAPEKQHDAPKREHTEQHTAAKEPVKVRTIQPKPELKSEHKPEHKAEHPAAEHKAKPVAKATEAHHEAKATEKKEVKDTKEVKKVVKPSKPAAKKE
jgi:small subunit ribosomal protein S2